MDTVTLRRTRLSGPIRDLVREVRVHPDQFLQPHFVVEGLDEPSPVSGMPGIHRESSDSLLRRIDADLEAGANKILLFGVPATKSAEGFGFDFTASQIEAVRRTFGRDVWLAVDVCLCSHTVHGHCGVLDESGTQVANRQSVSELARAAGIYASAGADCVAPSDMMDGRVATIRGELDAQGFGSTVIMSYSTKFHSSFYGPFRDAADSAPQSVGDELTDRASYQIDPARPSDALASARRDAAEGADILMVKPAMPYLDILARGSAEVTLPWAAYQTSAEYAALELLASHGFADRVTIHRETWIAMARAGASLIISYAARHARDWIE